MDRLYFLIAGIPDTTPSPVDIISGLQRVKDMGLDGMELEFVHNVWLTEQSAEKVKKQKEDLGLFLTIHAPYYINLNSSDNRIKYGSINRIFKSVYIGALAGVYSVTFHPGYYLKDSKEDAFNHVLNSLKKLEIELEEKHIDSMYIRPETTGKPSQFGTVQEILELSKEFKFLQPCIDFAHLHARSNGAYNTVDEFKQVIDEVYETLGDEGLKNLHLHYSGIEYSEKGERKHLPLQESDANYVELLKVLKESGAAGMFVCESPIRDTDTPLLKETYLSL